MYILYIISLIITSFYCMFTTARLYSKNFKCVNVFDPYNTSAQLTVLSFLFINEETISVQGFGNFLKDT
jgi:hypothetical protein